MTNAATVTETNLHARRLWLIVALILDPHILRARAAADRNSSHHHLERGQQSGEPLETTESNPRRRRSSGRAQTGQRHGNHAKKQRQQHVRLQNPTVEETLKSQRSKRDHLKARQVQLGCPLRSTRTTHQRGNKAERSRHRGIEIILPTQEKRRGTRANRYEERGQTAIASSVATWKSDSSPNKNVATPAEPRLTQPAVPMFAKSSGTTHEEHTIVPRPQKPFNTRELTVTTDCLSNSGLPSQNGLSQNG